MASNDDAERRRYERIAGNGTQAVLRPRGAAEMRVAIIDISRGGVSLRCDWRADAGTEVPIGLPGAAGPVIARIVRSRVGCWDWRSVRTRRCCGRSTRHLRSFRRELLRRRDRCARGFGA